MKVLTPVFGAAATTSCPFLRSLSTVFDPMRPVPPMTTIFMSNLLACDARKNAPSRRAEPFYGGIGRLCQSTGRMCRVMGNAQRGKPVLQRSVLACSALGADSRRTGDAGTMKPERQTALQTPGLHAKERTMPSILKTPLAVLASATALAITPADAQQLEPFTHAFVDSLTGPPLYTLTPDAARAVLSSAQKSVEVSLPVVISTDRVLKVGPDGRTNTRVVRPAGTEGPLPVVIYIHGGGWVLGDKDTHDRLVRELAVGAKAVVIFVDYDRSPESRYPTAIEQSYAVAKYVAEHADEFGADASRLAVAGDSVGGNMAAVIALMAKERKGPNILAQLLFYPVTDASMSSASYDEFADGPWLTRPAMSWFWDQYLPDAAKRSDIHASPLNASIEQLRELPQTLLLVDENDVLRDEGEAYGRKLAQSGVKVTSIRYNGTIHDFMLLNPIAHTPAVRAAVEQANSYLREVFIVR